MARRWLVAALIVAGSVPAGVAALADDGPSAPPPSRAAGASDDPIVALLGKLRDDQAPEVRLEGLKEAKTLDDPRLVPALGKLLKAPEGGVRVGAMEDLGARSSPETRKKAATLLAERLKPLQTLLEKDPSQKEEMLSLLRALHDLAQPTAIDALLADLATHTDLDVLEARAMAVGNIPDAKAIEGLIDQMGRGRRDGSGLRARLSKALVYATGATINNDVDSWRAWWKAAKPNFDFAEAAARREKLRAERAAKEGAKKGKDKAPKGDPPKDPPGGSEPR